MSTTTCDLRSIGQLAADFQKSVPRLERAVEQMNLRPSMRLNGVPYFDAKQVEQIEQALHPRTDAEKE